MGSSVKEHSRSYGGLNLAKNAAGIDEKERDSYNSEEGYENYIHFEIKGVNEKEIENQIDEAITEKFVLPASLGLFGSFTLLAAIFALNVSLLSIPSALLAILYGIGYKTNSNKLDKSIKDVI